MDFRLGYKSKLMAFRSAWRTIAGAATAGTTVRSTFTVFPGPRPAFPSGFSLPSLFVLLGTLFFEFLLLFLLLYFVGEGSDDLFSFILIDSNNSEFVFEWIAGDTLEYRIDFGLFIVIDEDAAHEASCFLVDVNAYVLDWPILIESFLNVLVRKVTVDVLHVQAAVLLQIQQWLYRLSLLLLILYVLILQFFQFLNSGQFFSRLFLLSCDAGLDLFVGEVNIVSAGGHPKYNYVFVLEALGTQRFKLYGLVATKNHRTVSGVEVYQQHLHIWGEVDRCMEFADRAMLQSEIV